MFVSGVAWRFVQLKAQNPKLFHLLLQKKHKISLGIFLNKGYHQIVYTFSVDHLVE